MKNFRVFFKETILLPRSSYFGTRSHREIYIPLFRKLNSWLSTIEELKNSRESYYISGNFSLVNLIGVEHSFESHELKFIDLILNTLSIFRFKIYRTNNKITITHLFVKSFIYEQIDFNGIIEESWKNASRDVIENIYFPLPYLTNESSSIENIQLKIIHLEMIGEISKIIESKVEEYFNGFPYYQKYNLVETLPYDIHTLIDNLENEVSLDPKTQEFIEKIGYTVVDGILRKRSCQTKAVEF